MGTPFTTSTVTNDNLLMSYFDRKELTFLKDEVQFYAITEKRPLPKGSGKSMTFNGWKAMAGASAALSEYATSATNATVLSARKVTRTLYRYGRSIAITDDLNITSVLPCEAGALTVLENSTALTVDDTIQMGIFQDVRTRVGQQSDAKNCLSAWMSAAQSSFCLNTAALPSGLTQFAFPVVFGCSCALSGLPTASAKASASISARLGPIAIRKAVARLRRFNVKPFANGKYIGIAHPNAISTMLGNSDYKAWLTGYVEGPKETMFKHKVATVHNVDLLESNNVIRYTGAAIGSAANCRTRRNLNLTFICGQGAVACSELDGGIKSIIHRPGSQSMSDVYESTAATLAFTYRGAAAAINPSAGVILVTYEYV